jgi:hypothetical protein
MVAKPLHIGLIGRRADERLTARHSVDLPPNLATTNAEPIALPICQQEVTVIASAGFPLWEPLDSLQLRNRRITLAYGDLSQQLARLIAGGEDPRTWDANWCTFATWSSRTIGMCIDRQPEHSLIHQLVARVPAPLRNILFQLSEQLLSRDHGAIYRTLAIGNRLVFLEIATIVSHFLERFGASSSALNNEAFDGYWSEVQIFLRDLSRLDPSWLASPPPDPTMLRAGMTAYYSALGARNRKERSELVLLGNLLLGAYEQTRVEDYLTVTLSFFTGSALRQLICGIQPRLLAWAWRELTDPLSTIYALFSTRFFLALELPTSHGMAELMVGQPVPPIDEGASDLAFPPDLQHISNPELQAVLTRYDLSDRCTRRTRAVNWDSFADRMNYITNLFRSRQHDGNLFRDPWTVAEQIALLAGRLPEGEGPLGTAPLG